MGDVFAEESFKFGEILGVGEGENRGVFYRRMPQNWEIFGGWEGKNEAPCVEEIPPERARTEAVPGREKGGKWQQKRTAATNCHSPFRVPLL